MCATQAGKRPFWHRQPGLAGLSDVILSNPIKMSDAWMREFLADEAAMQELDEKLDRYRVETREIRGERDESLKSGGTKSLKSDEEVIKRVFLSSEEGCKSMLSQIFHSKTVESRVLMGRLQSLVFEADEECLRDLSRSKRARYYMRKSESILEALEAKEHMIKMLISKVDSCSYKTLLEALQFEKGLEPDTVDELIDMVVYVMNPDRFQEGVSMDHRREKYRQWKEYRRLNTGGECVRVCSPGSLGLFDALLGVGRVWTEEGGRARPY